MLRSRLMAAAVMVGMAAAAPALPAAVVRPQVTASDTKRKGLFNGQPYAEPLMYGHRGPGTTMAQQKRAAKKRKNRARHKLAMKRR